jgi:hypothetical protein
MRMKSFLSDSFPACKFASYFSAVKLNLAKPNLLVHVQQGREQTPLALRQTHRARAPFAFALPT